MRLTVGVVLILFGLQTYQCMKWNVFSTKTLYKWSHDESPPRENKDHKIFVDGTMYDAIHLNGVYRHGARNPSSSKMEKIISLHKKLVDNKENDKFRFLDTWSSKYDKKMGNMLVTNGINEINDLGKRVGIRFKQLLYSNGKHIKYVSSRKTRTRDSSKYFYEGVAYGLTSLGAYVNEVNDNTTRFYDGCFNYERDVEESVTNLRQFTDFHETPEYITFIKSLKSRLGLRVSLTPDDVYLMYELCSYEKYIFNEEYWCSLMTDAERNLLEYGQDLEKYYESSYGHRMNSNLSCPLVRDIFVTMDKAIHDDWDYNNISNEAIDSGYLAGKFHFGHSETVVQLFTSLGLFKDPQPLLATNMAAMKNRQFKTSDIAPFSTNIVFAVYASNLKDLNRTEKRTFVVKLFVNEKAVIIPACGSVECSYAKVRTYYADLIDKCNIVEMCGSEDDDNDDDDDDDNGVAFNTGNKWTCALVLACYIMCTYFQ